MKFKELLDVLIPNENLYVNVSNEYGYDSFSGKIEEFVADERFHTLEVDDVRTAIVNDTSDHRIDENIMSVAVEIRINLYDPDCKVLEPYEED